MDWMWWGVSCSQDNSAAALTTASSQLYAHGGGILLSENLRRESLTTIDATNALVGVLGILGVVTAPLVAIPLAIAGIAKLGWDKRDLLSRVKQYRSQFMYRRLDESALSFQTRIDGTLGDLLSILSQQIPMVVVLDDAHWAHERTLRALDRVLTSRDSRVLVIATTWPHALPWNDEQLQPESPLYSFRQWSADFEARFPSSTEVIEIESMSATEMEALLPEEFPSNERNDSSFLIDFVDGNPLVLRGLLRIDTVTRAISKGKIEQTGLRIPSNVAGMFRLYWNEFPDWVKRALCVASVLGEEFMPQVVDDVLAVDIVSRNDALDYGRDSSWLQVVDEFLVVFGEHVLFEITRDDSFEFLSEEDQATIRDVFTGMFDQLERRINGRAISRLREIDVQFAMDQTRGYSRRGFAYRSALALTEENWSNGDLGTARRFGEVCLDLLKIEHHHSGAPDRDWRNKDEGLQNLLFQHAHSHWVHERATIALADILIDMDEATLAAPLYEWLKEVKKAQVSASHPLSIEARVGLAMIHLHRHAWAQFDDEISEIVELLNQDNSGLGGGVPGCTHCVRASQMSLETCDAVVRMLKEVRGSETISNSDEASFSLALVTIRAILHIAAGNQGAALSILRPYMPMVEQQGSLRIEFIVEYARTIALYSDSPDESAAAWSMLLRPGTKDQLPQDVLDQARYWKELGSDSFDLTECWNYIETNRRSHGTIRIRERERALNFFAEQLTARQINELWSMTVDISERELRGNVADVASFLTSFTATVRSRPRIGGQLPLAPIEALVESELLDGDLLIRLSRLTRTLARLRRSNDTDYLQQRILLRGKSLDDLSEAHFATLESDRAYVLAMRTDPESLRIASEIFQDLLSRASELHLSEDDRIHFEGALKQVAQRLSTS